MIRRSVNFLLKPFNLELTSRNARFPGLRQIDPHGIEVLDDKDFIESCNEVKKLTLLDISRLANLWNLCRLSNPAGNILEIGSYKGGGALHISNSSPGRKIIVFDSFGDSFEKMNHSLDTSFNKEMFKDNSKEAVESLFRNKGRQFQVVSGFFPASAKDIKIEPVSFVHLDVDVYEASRDSLAYLVDNRLLLNRSFIVLDDFNRKAHGVNQAVDEFLSTHKNWTSLPLFPGQGVLFDKSWFE